MGSRARARASLFVIAALVVMAFGVQAGSAARPAAKRCSVHMTARAELACGLHAEHVQTCVVRWVKNHGLARRLSSQRSPQMVRYFRNMLRNHLWLLREARGWVQEARSRLAAAARPANVPQGGIAHMALWLCIHKGEGAWNDNTGNGYYGGLQMTSGWGGVDRPDKLSPYAQMALAEHQYAASHYSSAWLSQQWPNTYPPCAGYAS